MGAVHGFARSVNRSGLRRVHLRAVACKAAVRMHARVPAGQALSCTRARLMPHAGTLHSRAVAARWAAARRLQWGRHHPASWTTASGRAWMSPSQPHRSSCAWLMAHAASRASTTHTGYLTSAASSVRQGPICRCVLPKLLSMPPSHVLAVAGSRRSSLNSRLHAFLCRGLTSS